LLRRKLFGSIDHQLSAEIYFVAIGSLERVERKSWYKINNYSCMEREKKEDSSLYRGCKLLLSEDWFEVMRVDCGVASIPPFRVDIPLSSESIWFGAKITRMESNDKVELRKILGPLCLFLD